MISSTALDLPEHRKEVMEACLRQGMFPNMMEHLPALDAEAIPASLAMIDKADIYVLILAHRYGHVPRANNPSQISVTEHEYNRAAELKIPSLVFVMHADHPLKAADVEKGEGAIKLENFKSCALTKVVSYFKSPSDLRAQVINSLSHYRVSDPATFHYVTEIPASPEAFIAHPYTLLQTHNLVGRQAELKLLTDWVTGKQLSMEGKVPGDRVRIISVVAIGGMGKSALTWKWFNEIAPQEMKPLAGRMWWSFYESDATFENFVTRALAYVKQSKLDEVRQMPIAEREMQLLTVLDSKPFLIVLDGFERMLNAYARMDAAHIIDDDHEDYDKQTINLVATSIDVPAAAQSLVVEHRLRKSADPRAGLFLRKLANVKSARILVSTRLYPADLQNKVNGEPLPGCAAIFLRGLVDDDALELWRAFGVTGARDSLLWPFNQVGNHSLLIQTLASEIARYRAAPGDFEKWRHDHPGFDPLSLPLDHVKSHVLEFALRGLDDMARQTLHIIAAFRMPARYDALAALLIGEGKLCGDEHELDKVLTELEDRGLVGWDKRANRYDLHPIVRTVVWRSLSDDARRTIYTSLHQYFEAFPKPDDYLKVNNFDEITSTIELYNTLIGLTRYDEAGELFFKYLNKVAFYRLPISRQVVELLEMLFPDGSEQPQQLPFLSEVGRQADTLRVLGVHYGFSGNQQRGISLFRRSHDLSEEHGDLDRLVMEENLAEFLCSSGSLYASEAAGRKSCLIARRQNDEFREARNLRRLGVTLASRGEVADAEIVLHQARQAFVQQGEGHWVGATLNEIAKCAFWTGNHLAAMNVAKDAWTLVDGARCVGCSMVAKRLEGMAAAGLGEIEIADKCLRSVLQDALEAGLPEKETEALIGLADLRRRQTDLQGARELLDDVWAPAERGPYTLIHADARNVLTQIERDTGNRSAAIEAATRAYRLAWCDGPPFAYHWGLEKAKQHLRELGVTEPLMPPFDKAEFEPMPEVEIDDGESA